MEWDSYLKVVTGSSWQLHDVCSCHRVHMMHHALPRGTALCGATLRPPEVGFSASKDFLICTLLQNIKELLNILLCILQLHF